jgi:branched-chain amino acid transport system substrate-binding protein
MKEQLCSPQLSVFRHKAARLGFLASIFIAICAMLSCDQAELASSPSEETAFSRAQMQLLPGSTLKTDLPQTAATFATMKAWNDQSGDIGSLGERIIKVGLIMEGELAVNARYGAELAMFETNQAGGVLGLPIELLPFDGEPGKDDVLDDIYGPRINGDDQDGDIYGPPTGKGDEVSPDGPYRQEGEIMGGIMGFPIALVVKDNQDDPMLSAELAEELIIQDGVAAIIGPGYSRNALQVAPVAQSYGVPLVTTTATNPNVTAPGDFVFMAAFADTFQGEVMAHFARQSLRARTAALLVEAGDPYVEGLAAFFEESFTDLGGDIVAKEMYSGGDTDFTSQLTVIAAEAPDVVFMPGFAPEVPLAIKQARTIPQENASGITATFLGGDGWEDADLIPMGGDALEESYFSTHFSAEAPNGSVQDFVQWYQSMFGISPDMNAAMGYDALKLVATAIRRAGSVDKEAIRDQLAATQGYKGATCIQSYDEHRHPIKGAVIMQIKDGQFKFHKYVEP